MNVTKVSSLKSLVSVVDAVYSVGASMTPTENGFMITRFDTSNERLKEVLLKNTSCDGARYLIKHAWGCGEDMMGGLHIVNV